MTSQTGYYSILSRIAQIPGSLLILTVGRLALIPLVVVSFDRLPFLTAGLLAVFIVADLYDGVAARRLEADDTARRALDSIVDRVSIWAVLLVVTSMGFLPVPLLLLFFARDLYCGHWCNRLVRERDVAICADWLYRALNLSVAGWVVAAPMVSQPVRSSIFLGIVVFSVIVAMDLLRSVRLVLSMPPHVRSAVIPAGDLRSEHGHGELRLHPRAIRST